MRDLEKYRALYSSLLKGYSEASYKKQTIYMRHLTEGDVGEVSSKRNQYIQEATDKGLPTEKEKLVLLEEQSIWTKQEETDLENLRKEVQNQEQTLKNLVIKSQKQILNSKILINKKELAKQEAARREALDLTCEEYGERKSQEEIILHHFFKDKSFKNPFFTLESFDDMHQVELHFLMSVHAQSQNEYSHQNIKRIAAFPFFLNTFFICNDDPMIFYGKPVVDLTLHQVSLFSVGKYFKAMISKSEAEPPETDDVDELIEWYESTLSKEELAKKLEGKQASTVVGATRDDMKEVIKDKGGLNLNQQAAIMRKETGKTSLDMDDMLRLHGYNIKDGRLKN